MSLSSTLADVIRSEFPFTMNPQQDEVTRQLAQYLLSPDGRSLFILRGYAGTGKTTLVAAVVRALLRLPRGVTLLAPTGRAAKVFSQHAGQPAFTIHKAIYRQRRVGDMFSTFTLNVNRQTDTLFIVDEASMIANEPAPNATFGSGMLLDDLLQFVAQGRNCRLLFVGDTAQLPPVNESQSPALQPATFQAVGYSATLCELTQVMRQQSESGILSNATMLRTRLSQRQTREFPKIRFRPFHDIRYLPGDELIDALESSYDRCGEEQTIVVVRSNKQAVAYNNGIRSMIFGREGQLTRGDILMVAKNNYFWTERLQAGLKAEAAQAGDTAQTMTALPMNFIANGDIAVVEHVNGYDHLYDLHFADVTLRFPDYDNAELDVRILLDGLQTEVPALTPEQNNRLYEGVMADYADYPTKAKRIEQLKKDPNYNALQVKYAYAVTCHKAQGGQWTNVFVDQGWIPPDSTGADYYRWLYTAMTRATHRLYLINWPTAQTS